MALRHRLLVKSNNNKALDQMNDITEAHRKAEIELAAAAWPDIINQRQRSSHPQP